MELNMRYLTQEEVMELCDIARCSMPELMSFAVDFVMEIEDDCAIPSTYTMANLVSSWRGAVMHSSWGTVLQLLCEATHFTYVHHLYNVLVRYNGCDDEDEGPLPPLTGYCTEETVYKFRAIRAWSRMLWLEKARKDGDDGSYAYEFCAVHMKLKD
jgi:hypothetical protein